MKYAHSFRDLTVYQTARSIANRFFEVSKSFPKDEKYSLTDQGRRSSRSIGAQIAEAWAKRRYERHFVSKLTDADAEQQETQHWIDTASDCGYLSSATQNELIEQLEKVGRMLQSMIDKAETFCRQPRDSIREEAPEYFVIGNR